MKSKIIVAFLSAFIVNIGNLDAFALEEKTQIIKSIDKANSNVYKFENTPNIFLSENTNNDFSISFRNEENNSNFNENAWLWSFLFPGVGQYAMGENNSGTLFVILGGITTLLTLAVILLGLGFSRDLSGIIILIIGGPIALLANLTVYILSIINAYFLSEQKKSSDIDHIGRRRAT